MLSERMQTALNQQINEEMYSAYIYLSMSAYFQGLSLDGFANWMRIQYQEETAHALKFFDYIYERGGDVTLLPIAGPAKTWEAPLHAFQEAYKHECKVSGLINELVNLAIEEKDHATLNFLQWFVSEQVEEEASADKIVQSLRLIDSNPAALFMLDREMAQRSPEEDEDEE